MCFILRGVFTKTDCERLLPPETKDVFEAAISEYPEYYRNNERHVVDNPALADELFDSVCVHLPQTLCSTPTSGDIDPWKLHGLNDRFRYYKYNPGQYIGRHYDGVYHQSKTVQSKLTFLLYLNDAAEFSGGRTLFYRAKDNKTQWATFTQQIGDLIVFSHELWDEIRSVGCDFHAAEPSCKYASILVRPRYCRTSRLTSRPR